MVMAAPVVLVLVTGNAVVKSHLAGQSAFRQQFERAVNRGIPDLRIFFLDQAVQFVGGEVLARIQKGPQDRVALFRMLQPDPLQMLVQNALRFLHHLPRDRGLVINTVLGSCGQEKNSTDLPAGCQLPFLLVYLRVLVTFVVKKRIQSSQEDYPSQLFSGVAENRIRFFP